MLQQINIFRYYRMYEIYLEFKSTLFEKGNYFMLYSTLIGRVICCFHGVNGSVYMPKVIVQTFKPSRQMVFDMSK